jgi:hypothetical protein
MYQSVLFHERPVFSVLLALQVASALICEVFEILFSDCVEFNLSGFCLKNQQLKTRCLYKSKH